MFYILLIAELVRQPSDFAYPREETTVPKLPFVAEHPNVEETNKFVLTAESTSCMQASAPAGGLSLLVNDEVVIPDSRNLFGDCFVPLTLTSSPCGDINSYKLVSSDVHLTLNDAVTVAESPLSDNAATLSPHSARSIVSPVSTGSDEVFITSCTQNSQLAPSIEPSADCAVVYQLDGQDMQLPSNATVADGAFVSEQMEENKTFEMSSLQQLNSSLFDDVSRSSSQSESESEPLGGCKDALLNPSHCISDLCLEDNDSYSIFGAAGFQSPTDTDDLCDHNDSADTVLFSVGHGLELSAVNSRIKRDLLDVSELDVSSISNSGNVIPFMEVVHDIHVNSCKASDAVISPFRSPPKSSVSDETSLYSCITPLTSSSPFRSPPRSSADFPTAKMMLPSDDAPFSEVSGSAANGTVQTTRGENSVSTFTEEDGAVVAESDAHISECRDNQLVSHCDEYTLDWTSELPVAAAASTSVEAAVNDVACNPSKNYIRYAGVVIRFQNGSPPWCDMYCTDKTNRQASVKQLKCKFESQQDIGSQVGAKSSQNFDSLPSFAECNFSVKSQSDAARSASAETTDRGCSKFHNSDAVQCIYNEHNSEHVSPSLVHKTTEAPASDGCHPSISARISCFEPVMSGCRKENKRARLSSNGSAVLDPSEKQLKGSSHSINEPFAEGRRSDADGWFVESPQRGRAKRYQRCSSAGHEDLLALLNIPATSAKNIPRVSERKRMFEVETAVCQANSFESTGIVASSAPASERDQYSCGSQQLSGMDKENCHCMYEGNCQGQVNSRRSLFEGTSACHLRNDSVDSESSVELDCQPFKYPVNLIKTKSRWLQTAVPAETSANSFERFKLT